MPRCTWCLKGKAREKVLDAAQVMHYFHPKCHESILAFIEAGGGSPEPYPSSLPPKKKRPPRFVIKRPQKEAVSGWGLAFVDSPAAKKRR